MLPVADGEGDGRCVETSSIVRPYNEQVASSRLIPERLCVRQQIQSEAGDRFVATPDHGASRAAFVGGLGHPSYLAVAGFGKVTPRPDETPACKRLLSIDRATSNYHGFDLRAGADPRTPETIKATMPGYYAFAAEADPAEVRGEAAGRRMIFIVLNTEQLDAREGGNTGRLQRDQMSFLSQALGCVGPRDLVFVFGHHALDEIRVPGGGRLGDAEELQNASGNIIAYFYGHDHQHGLCRRKRSCTKLWEIEAGSLLEFPQEGRMIRVKEVAGVGFLEMSTFTERLSGSTDGAFRQYVDRARRGAERDYCLQRGNRCAADGVPRREDGDYTHARLFFELPGSPAAAP
jgi:hypothetical protein